MLLLYLLSFVLKARGKREAACRLPFPDFNAPLSWLKLPSWRWNFVTVDFEQQQAKESSLRFLFASELRSN
jgi:hypothetical protein